MNSTNSASSKSRIPIASDDAQESLRRKFHRRLQTERTQLTVLATALTLAGEAATEAFERLRVCAHRMHGAAAVFEYMDVAAAAGTLEYASEVAAKANSGNFESPVWTALIALIDVLDHVAPQPIKSDG